VGIDPETRSVLDFYHQLGREGLSYFLFASLYVVRPEIYAWIPEEKSISMMTIFWKLLQAGERIAGTVLNSGVWSEVGNRASYLQLHRELAESIPVHERLKSILPADVQLRGICTVGRDCKIEAGAVLEDTIVWDRAIISSRSRLKRCIVCDDVQVDGDFSDCDFS
jgi:NDP-sugar pyrophosphorylase family protein